MSLKTKHVNDPKEKDDGYRLLVCRTKPRTTSKKGESWSGWCAELGPSPELYADFHNKKGPPITWEQFRERYLEEMKSKDELIDELAKLVFEGKTVTLVCSSSCSDEAHCHRTLLRGLIEERRASFPGAAAGDSADLAQVVHASAD